MILYQGSFLEIVKLDLVHSRPNLDFGRGFYVTPLYEQAAKWYGKFKCRGKDGIISRYEYYPYLLFLKSSFQIRFPNFSILLGTYLDCQNQSFCSTSSRINTKLKFQLLAISQNCRSGKDATDYDLVVGGVANDKVFNTVELFFDGLIDKKEAIKRLRYEKPNLQICFCTEKALSLLHFEGSEKL